MINVLINKLTDVKPEKVFLIIGLIFGIAFLLINPPFQVPDETHHYYKSLYISEGNLLPVKQGNISGVIIPENALNFFREFRIIGFNPDNKITPSNITSLLNAPLNNDNKIFKNMSYVGIVTYSPVPYIASSSFISIGKLFNSSPIVLMYLGRLANLLLYIFMVYWAIKTTPIQKWVFLLLALMPMTLFLAASLSADSFTIAISILTIAMFFKLAFDPEKKEVDTKDLSILITLLVLISLTKQIYLLLILLFFIIPTNKFGNKQKMFKYFILLLLPFVCITVVWSLLVSGLYMPIGEISIKGQIYNILSNPIGFLQVFLNSLFHYNIIYLVSFVGYFGWLDVYTQLPDNLVYLYITFLILASLTDKQVKNLNLTLVKKQKMVSLATFMITIISIFGLEYITWTPVGNKIIEGVQGRYFIPIAPLFFFLFYNNKININRNAFNWVKIIFIIVTLLISLYVIIKRYYIL